MKLKFTSTGYNNFVNTKFYGQSFLDVQIYQCWRTWCTYSKNNYKIAQKTRTVEDF